MGRHLGALPVARSRALIAAAAARATLLLAFRAAVAAVHAGTALRRHSSLEPGRLRIERGARCVELPLPSAGGPGRLRAVGAGKAAGALARGLEDVLGDRLDSGLVVVKHGHREALSRIRQLEGGHPLPDAASEAAARGLLEFVGTPAPEDRFVVLLTGGASAVLAAPAPGLLLEDKLQVTRQLLASGAPVTEINLVRRQLSAIKGGRLATRLAPACFVTVAVSDVPGDSPVVLGSGPTVPDPSTAAEALAILQRYVGESTLPPRVLQHLRQGSAGSSAAPMPRRLAGDHGYLVIASLDDALAAARDALQAEGWPTESLGRWLDGDVAERARAFAGLLRERQAQRGPGAAPLALLAGGEPTVVLRGGGTGGRCQEFALRVARELAGMHGFALLAAGTDGTDGPTPHAGGFADGGTWVRAAATGLDPGLGLARNDSSALLAAAGDLLDTGPTGTNVADLVLAVLH